MADLELEIRILRAQLDAALGAYADAVQRLDDIEGERVLDIDEYIAQFSDKELDAIRAGIEKSVEREPAQDSDRQIALLQAKLAAARRLYSQDAQQWDDELDVPLEPLSEVESRFDAEMEWAEKRFDDPHPLGGRIIPNI